MSQGAPSLPAPEEGQGEGASAGGETTGGNDVIDGPEVGHTAGEQAPAQEPSTPDTIDADEPHEGQAGCKEETRGVMDEPPEDWLEPLEEDDVDDNEDDGQSWGLDLLPQRGLHSGRREAEMDSLAGESERSGSLAGSERNYKRKSNSNGTTGTRHRRRQSIIDEEWEDWPALGKGWKRKEVFRRSGFSVGKTDTYYMSPSGERLRSKIELTKYVSGSIDLSMFDFKSGLYLNGISKRRKRGRPKVSRSPSCGNSERSVSSEPLGPLESCYTPNALLSYPHGSASQKTRSSSQLSNSTSLCSVARPSLSSSGGGVPSLCSVARPSLSSSGGGVPSLCSVARPSLSSSGGGAPSLCSVARSSLSSSGGGAPSLRSVARPLLSSPGEGAPSLRSVARPLLSSPGGGAPSLRSVARPLLSSPGGGAPSLRSVARPLLSSPGGGAPSLEFSPTQPESLLAPPFTPDSCSDCDALDLNHKGSFSVSHPSPLSLSPSLEPGVNVNEVGHKSSMQDMAVHCCVRCGIQSPAWPFGGTHRLPLCSKCRSEMKPYGGRNIVFRKWLPCGQCLACRITEDCGMCASCRNGLLNPESRKPVRCRRRKCLCPIRKEKAKPDMRMATVQNCSSLHEEMNAQIKSSFPLQHQNMHFQLYSTPFLNHSEDFLLYVDDDDSEVGPKRRSRRSCGSCEACVRTSDCGSCDFCVDKPKFGGSNKKRQKCRLRQCQLQAMLGQSEFMTPEGWVGLGRPKPHYKYANRSTVLWEDPQLTDDEAEECGVGTIRPGFNEPMSGEHRGDGTQLSQMGMEVSTYTAYPSNGKLDKKCNPSICRVPVQTYDRATGRRFELVMENGLPGSRPNSSSCSAHLPQGTRVLYSEATEGKRGPMVSVEADERLGGRDIAALDVNQGDHHMELDTAHPEVREVTPKIAEIFSLAGSTQPSRSDTLEDQDLWHLLEALRAAIMPDHWVALMVEGPQLQLVQCSKLSTMADTVVHIEPDLSYQVSVQSQQLLPTHPVYEGHPSPLASVPSVASLLVYLEGLAVCRGFPVCAPSASPGASLCERAATCDFLVPQTKERCGKCCFVPKGL